MNDRLPDPFIRDGLRLAEGATLFGILLSDLSRDELIAAAAKGWDAFRKEIERKKL